MNILEAVLWLTLNVYHEARGEDVLGQVSVVHVTLNRAKNRNLSVKETVLQPYQFSWTQQLDSYWPNDPQAFFNCLEVVVDTVGGYDFTNGAEYYHRYDISPKWASSYVIVAKIDHHIFYRRK